MQSKATTVKEYLAELPPDRRAALEAVRKVILDNLDEGFVERMSYGMIGYAVPHSLYPAGYHCDPKQPLPFAGLASQKGHMSLYLMCIYNSSGEAAEFQSEWAKTGKKLDMGKACIRFKKVDDLALDLIGRVIKRMTVKKYIGYYESAIKVGAVQKQERSAERAASKKGAAKRPAKKPAAAR